MSANHHERVRKLLAVATAVVPDGMDEAQRKATHQEAGQAAILACRMIVKHGMLTAGGQTFTAGKEWVKPGGGGGGAARGWATNAGSGGRATGGTGGGGGSGFGFAAAGLCVLCGLGSRAYDPFDLRPDPDEKWVVAWQQVGTVGGATVGWRQAHVHLDCFTGCRECWALSGHRRECSQGPGKTPRGEPPTCAACSVKGHWGPPDEVWIRAKTVPGGLPSTNVQFHAACFPGCRECFCLEGHEDHCKNRGAP